MYTTQVFPDLFNALTGSRPHEAGKRRTKRSTERDRAVQETKGRRIQEVRGRGALDASIYGPEITRQATELIYPQHTSGNKKAEEDAAKDAENKVDEIKEAGKEKGGKVIEELLRAVMDVKPEKPNRVAAPPKS